MHINTLVIPHEQQRYNTVGDWWFENNNETLQLRVSAMGDWRYEALVALHEQVEALLCLQRNITSDVVDKFDMLYEAKREAGDPDFQGEPGDSKDAPYRKEHFFATNVERLTAAELDINWEEYDNAVQAL